MVKHIILWQLKDELTGVEKEQIKNGIKQGLEGLLGKIPGLMEIHVYKDGLSSSNADLMLDSTFIDEQSLKNYAVHPEHVAVADGKVRPYTKNRVCLDYEIEKNQYLLSNNKKCDMYKKVSEECDVVAETADYKIKEQGEYTIEDYYELPDEQRVELIDGRLYDMAAPSSMHQEIAGDIYYQIRDYIRKNEGKCKPFISPVDVRLDRDEKTMVQPDVFVLCDLKKLKKWGVFGAPDFIIEIISPATKRKDYVTKADKYMNAGVREYWIIDPYKNTLVKYDFEDDINISLSGLNQPVGVGIYHEELKIVFSNILKIINEFDNLSE